MSHDAPAGDTEESSTSLQSYLLGLGLAILLTLASFGAAARTEVCERHVPESSHFNKDPIYQLPSSLSSTFRISRSEG